MTTNQIILLLDLHRGTHTQKLIGTHNDDLFELAAMGYINHERELTLSGQEKILSILSLFDKQNGRRSAVLPDLDAQIAYVQKVQEGTLKYMPKIQEEYLMVTAIIESLKGLKLLKNN